MLKDIRELWQDDSMMKGAVALLADMVSKAAYVYAHAWEVCTGKAVAERIADDLKEHDRAVNRGEREIRRVVVEHLSLNPGRDVSGCLALMIMAKDVERIGDHSRNIYGLGARLDSPLVDFRLFSAFDSVQKGIGVLMGDLERAIRESNDEIAHAILSRYQEMKADTKELQSRLFTEPLAGVEAVASAMLTRFLVRINAHIGNVASGVIFPLENIDFVSRGLRQEQKE